jgi:hypothetical protein
MVWWRAKNPAMFVPSFHDAMAQGIGDDKLVFLSDDKDVVVRMQKEFRLFRFCLRERPTHPLAKFERNLEHRTRITFNPTFRRWELLLTSRVRLTDQMEITESLGQTT